MSSLVDLITRSISNQNLAAIGQQIGASPQQTQSAIDEALPVLVGSLARQEKTGTSGWNLLTTFLDKNHDGSIMDDLMQMAMGGQSSAQGNAAVSQLLGKQQSLVTEQVAHNSGLDPATIARLLPLLAPMVIGALGKVQKEQSLDQRGLNRFLEVEKTQAVSRSASAGDLLSLFDENKDGSIIDDLAKKGAGLLSKLFSSGQPR